MGSSSPIATWFIPSGASTNPVGTNPTTSDDLAQFVKDRANELQAAKDTTALQGLADGHTEAFLNFAKDRIKVAASDDERTYWQRLADRTQQKVEDANIAAGVQTGATTLEQLHQHILDRQNAVGPNDPNYADYVKQEGDVKNAILARDFHSEIIDAQKRLIDTGDHTAYLQTLTGMLARAKDPSAQADLVKQIDALRGEITKEQTLVQAQHDNQVLTGYYAHDGSVSGSDAIAYLRKQAASATDPAQAAAYTNEAQKVDAEERSQIASLRAGSTSSNASITSALAPFRQSFLDAMEPVKTATSNSSVPEQQDWSLFNVQSQKYKDAILAAMPNASPTQRVTLQNELDAVTTALNSQQRAAGTAVVKDVAQQSASYSSLIAQAKATGDVETETQLTHQYASVIQGAMGNTFVTDDQKQSLNQTLSTVLRSHQTAIAGDAALLSGNADDQKFVTSANTLFREYSAGGGSMDRQSFLNALADGAGGDPARLAVQLGLGVNGNPAPADVAKATRWASNYGLADDARQQRLDDATKNFGLRTAPRDQNGRLIGSTQDAVDRAILFGGEKSGLPPGGPGTQDDTQPSGAALDAAAASVPALSAPTPVPPPQRDANGNLISGGSPAAAASGGGHLASLTPPADASGDVFTSEDGAPPAGPEADYNLSLIDPQLKPYYAAEDYLAQPTPLQLPAWELPDLPSFSAFMPKSLPFDLPKPPSSIEEAGDDIGGALSGAGEAIGGALGGAGNAIGGFFSGVGSAVHDALPLPPGGA